MMKNEQIFQDFLKELLHIKDSQEDIAGEGAAQRGINCANSLIRQTLEIRLDFAREMLPDYQENRELDGVVLCIDIINGITDVLSEDAVKQRDSEFEEHFCKKIASVLEELQFKKDELLSML